MNIDEEAEQIMEIECELGAWTMTERLKFARDLGRNGVAYTPRRGIRYQIITSPGAGNWAIQREIAGDREVIVTGWRGEIFPTLDFARAWVLMDAREKDK